MNCVVNQMICSPDHIEQSSTLCLPLHGMFSHGRPCKDNHILRHNYVHKYLNLSKAGHYYTLSTSKNTCRGHEKVLSTDSSFERKMNPLEESVPKADIKI